MELQPNQSNHFSLVTYYDTIKKGGNLYVLFWKRLYKRNRNTIPFRRFFKKKQPEKQKGLKDLKTSSQTLQAF